MEFKNSPNGSTVNYLHCGILLYIALLIKIHKFLSVINSFLKITSFDEYLHLHPFFFFRISSRLDTHPTARFRNSSFRQEQAYRFRSIVSVIQCIVYIPSRNLFIPVTHFRACTDRFSWSSFRYRWLELQGDRFLETAKQSLM